MIFLLAAIAALVAVARAQPATVGALFAPIASRPECSDLFFEGSVPTFRGGAGAGFCGAFQDVCAADEACVVFVMDGITGFNCEEIPPLCLPLLKAGPAIPTVPISIPAIPTRSPSAPFSRTRTAAFVEPVGNPSGGVPFNPPAGPFPFTPSLQSGAPPPILVAPRTSPTSVTNPNPFASLFPTSPVMTAPIPQMQTQAQPQSALSAYDLVFLIPFLQQLFGGAQQNSARCEDSHIFCKGWADGGECRANAVWMAGNCRASCHQCSNAPRPGPSGSCRDGNDMCGRWAEMGECGQNPDWMLPNCPRSCQRCSSTSQTLAHDNTGGSRVINVSQNQKIRLGSGDEVTLRLLMPRLRKIQATLAARRAIILKAKRRLAISRSKAAAKKITT